MADAPTTGGTDKTLGKTPPDVTKEVDSTQGESERQVVKADFDAAGRGAVRSVTATERDRPSAESTVLKTGFRSADDLLPAADATKHFSNQEMIALWEKQVSANDGKPLSIMKGYYEANLTKVDAAEHPNGLLISSSESVMTLKKNAILIYPDGSAVELKAGTTFPNGVQLSPRDITTSGETNKLLNATVIAPDDGAKLSDGTVLKSGGTLVGEAIVEKGQLAEPGEYVVTRNSVDTKTGALTLDTYPSNVNYWNAVPGKPGTFSPKSDNAYAINVIQVPGNARGEFDVSYGGIAPLEPGDIIARSEKTLPDGAKKIGFRRISEQAAVETYRGADASSAAVLSKSAQELSDKSPAAIPLSFDNAADFNAANLKLVNSLRAAVDSDPAKLLKQAEEQGGKIRIGDVQINVSKDKIGDVPRGGLKGPADEAATFKALFHRYDQDLQKLQERTGGSPVDTNGYPVWKFNPSTDATVAGDTARDAALAGSRSIIVQFGGDTVRVTPGMTSTELSSQRKDFQEKSRILDFRLKQGIERADSVFPNDESLRVSLLRSDINRIREVYKPAGLPQAVWDKHLWDELPAATQKQIAAVQSVKEGGFEPLSPEQIQALEQSKAEIVTKLAGSAGDDGAAGQALQKLSTTALDADGKTSYKFNRDVDPAKAADIATKVATATQLDVPIELNGIKLTARPDMFKEKLQSDYETMFARARVERLAEIRSSRRDGSSPSPDDSATPRRAPSVGLTTIAGGRANEAPSGGSKTVAADASAQPPGDSTPRLAIGANGPAFVLGDGVPQQGSTKLEPGKSPEEAPQVANVVTFKIAPQLEDTPYEFIKKNPEAALELAKKQGGMLKMGEARIPVNDSVVGDTPRSFMAKDWTEIDAIDSAAYRYRDFITRFKGIAGGAPDESGVWNLPDTIPHWQASTLPGSAAHAMGKSLYVQWQGGIVEMTVKMTAAEFDKQLALEKDHADSARRQLDDARERAQQVFPDSVPNQMAMLRSEIPDIVSTNKPAGIPDKMWQRQLWNHLPADVQTTIADAQGGETGAFLKVKRPSLTPQQAETYARVSEDQSARRAAADELKAAELAKAEAVKAASEKSAKAAKSDSATESPGGNVTQFSAARRARPAPRSSLATGSLRQDGSTEIATPVDPDSVVIQPDAFRKSTDRAPGAAEAAGAVDPQRVADLSRRMAEINTPAWSAMSAEQRAEVTDLVDKAGLEPHQERKMLDVLKGDGAKNVTTLAAWIALVSTAIAAISSEASAEPPNLEPNTYGR